MAPSTSIYLINNFKDATIAIFQVIYWSEFERGHIMRLDLYNKSVRMVKEENPQLFALRVYDADKQPEMKHVCKDSPCQGKKEIAKKCANLDRTLVICQLH
jgi:hypothetical protein